MVIRNKLLVCSAIGSLLFSSAVRAEMIERNTAQMQAMDKITGRVSVVDVPVNSEVAFGSFSIVVRACKATPPEETPENYAFVDVADSSFGKMQFNIFKGWMMSSSPALNAVEHPIYDVWLLKCTDKTVDQSKLLTAEQLQERDKLPKLADIKQDKKQTAVSVSDTVSSLADQNAAEEAKSSEDENKEKVLEDYTNPASAIVEAAPVEIVPLAEVSAEEPVVEEADAGGAPQSLLNIPDVSNPTPPAEPSPESSEIKVDETNIIESGDWVELPSASNSVSVKEPLPLDVTEPPAESPAVTVETQVSGEAAVSDPALSEPAAAESIENLPEDEEDQFIDLSIEADATAALEAELSAEALKN